MESLIYPIIVVECWEDLKTTSFIVNSSIDLRNIANGLDVIPYDNDYEMLSDICQKSIVYYVVSIENEEILDAVDKAAMGEELRIK